MNTARDVLDPVTRNEEREKLGLGSKTATIGIQKAANKTNNTKQHIA